MNKDYENLILKFEAAGYKLSEEQAQEIYKMQKADQENLLEFIAKILLSYTIIDAALSISDGERRKLRKEFESKITSIATSQYKSEKNIIKDILKDSTKNMYYASAYTLNIGINFNLKKLHDEEIKIIVEKTIQSEIWSDRLWDNKKILMETLKQQTEAFLQGKVNVNQIEKVIKDKFNQNAFNTHRLVQTEVAKCQNAANDLFAEKKGIKKQLFNATLDSRTSEICRGYDGKVFDRDDPLKPVPPLHPFCRSCLINVPYEEWKPKMRKDNVTKELIPYMTYEEWYEENVKV